MADLSVDIAANAEQAKSQVRALGREFGLTADEMDDLVDAGKDLGKTTDDIARDISKVSGQPFEEVRREVRQADDALDDMERQARRTDAAVDDIGGTGTASLGKIKGAAQEVTQEGFQNLGEAVSSVRGNMSDLGQVGQDTLGGLAATLAGTGPAGLIGAAALAAGAVGLGLITASLEEQAEQADRLKERLSDAYTQAAEDGRAYLDVVSVVANAQDLINNPERADEWNKVQETQKETGIAMSEILKANAGDLDALANVQSRVNDLNRESAERGDEVNITQALTGDNLQQLAGFWNQAGDAAQDSHDRAAASIAATTALLLEEINATQGAIEKTDDFGNRLITLPSGKEIVINAETGQATTDVNQFKQDSDGIQREITQTVRVVRDSSAWDDWSPREKQGYIRANKLDVVE